MRLWHESFSNIKSSGLLGGHCFIVGRDHSECKISKPSYVSFLHFSLFILCLHIFSPPPFFILISYITVYSFTAHLWNPFTSLNACVDIPSFDNVYVLVVCVSGTLLQTNLITSLSFFRSSRTRHTLSTSLTSIHYTLSHLRPFLTRTTTLNNVPKTQNWTYFFWDLLKLVYSQY